VSALLTRFATGLTAELVNLFSESFIAAKEVKKPLRALPMELWGVVKFI
jgi:hypothetical protein